MATNDESILQIQKDLTALSRQVEQRVAVAIRSWEHPIAGAGPMSMSDSGIASKAEAVEQAAIKLACESLASQSQTAASLGIIRIANDLKRLDGLAMELSKIRAIGSSSADLQERLHKMAELSLVQLERASEALAAWSHESAVNATSQDEELDAWYDVLMADVLDDLAEERGSVGAAKEALHLARVLERVGDHATGIVAGLKVATATTRA